MKRYIAIVLAVLMAVSMAGCGQARDLFPESTGDGDVSQTAPVDEEGMKVGYLLPSGTDETDTSSRIESIRQMQYETLGFDKLFAQLKAFVATEQDPESENQSHNVPAVRAPPCFRQQSSIASLIVMP